MLPDVGARRGGGTDVFDDDIKCGSLCLLSGPTRQVGRVEAARGPSPPQDLRAALPLLALLDGEFSSPQAGGIALLPPN